MPGPNDQPEPNSVRNGTTWALQTPVPGTDQNAPALAFANYAKALNVQVNDKSFAEVSVETALLLSGETFLNASCNPKIPLDLRVRLEKKGILLLSRAAEWNDIRAPANAKGSDHSLGVVAPKRPLPRVRKK